MTTQSNSSRISDLQKLVDTIAGIAHSVSVDLGAGQLGVDDQISIGHLLVSLAKTADKALDPIKVSMRNEALKRGGSPGTVHLHSAHGANCTVSIPKPSLNVRKDADMDRLRALLGAKFDSYFETLMVFKPRPGFADRTASCTDPSERDAVIEAVKMDEGTPRVSFSR